MPTKPQHARRYREVPKVLRRLREEADLTQRALGALLEKPQSWIHNCEVATRRVDVAEFCAWCEACGVDPAKEIARLGAAKGRG